MRFCERSTIMPAFLRNDSYVAALFAKLETIHSIESDNFVKLLRWTTVLTKMSSFFSFGRGWYSHRRINCRISSASGSRETNPSFDLRVSSCRVTNELRSFKLFRWLCVAAPQRKVFSVGSFSDNEHIVKCKGSSLSSSLRGARTRNDIYKGRFDDSRGSRFVPSP